MIYKLSCADNDSYMLGQETRKAATAEERKFYGWRFVQGGAQHPATCATCGRKVDPHYVSATFDLRKRSFDLSATYDGYVVASIGFRAACEAAGLSGVEFLPIPSLDDFYILRIHQVLETDFETSRIRKLLYCETCHHYAGVFKPAGLCFSSGTVVKTNGLYRSDVEFGQAHEQHPIFLAGSAAAQELTAANLTGLSFRRFKEFQS